MKKLITSATVILLLICTVGCTLPLFGQGETFDIHKITEADSVSQLNLYPENGRFSVVGKFDRAGYSQLNGVQKNIYILLDNAVFNMQSGYISLGKTAQSDIVKAYFALRNDRPEYFWIPMSYSLRTKGELQEICLAKTSSEWLYTEAERKENEGKILAFLTEFDQNLTGTETEFERELLAHDILADLIEYDHENINNYENNPSAWDITGGIIDGLAVCEGYSKSMQLLAFFSGLNCATVTGIANEPHMWNVISINNSWYHLDLTADDSDNNGYHFYFNVTTEYILKSREIDSEFDAAIAVNSENRSNIFLPNCVSVEQNYHIVNSLYIAETKQVESTVVSIICDAKRQGKRQVEFAVSPEMGFVFGQDDAKRFFKLERCISVANAELGSKRIKKYSYGGIEGALGFMVAW